MSYATGYPAPWPQEIKTKKDLKAALKDHPEMLEFYTDRGLATLKELWVFGVTNIVVTNHPKRTWFADVSTKDGRVLR